MERDQTHSPAADGGGSGNREFYSGMPLYVGDLEKNVTEEQLYEVFRQIGTVTLVKVARDHATRCSLGYAYVNYLNDDDAARALEDLNNTLINGKPIRIIYANRNPSLRTSNAANIFIKNLDKAVDDTLLRDTFSAFGNILSCKVARDSSGQSKGYGFVQFDQDEAAKNAINKLNGMLLNDKEVFVGLFLPKPEREIASNNTTFNNVYVKNLSESTTNNDLMIIFGEFGCITSAAVMFGDDGKSKCFGFVNFESPNDAARSVKELNGKKVDEKEWYVSRAQKKSERETELKGRFEVDKYQGRNLYLKNLDDSIVDYKLEELFSKFGTVISCKIMQDPNGRSKGFGFVSFSSPEEASRAVEGMNRKMVGSKPLYVALAQQKEERRALLQAHYSQVPTVARPPSVGPHVPMPPGSPGIGQSIFYGQGPPSIIPPQAHHSQVHSVAMPPSVGPHVPMPPGSPGLGQSIFYGQGPPSIIPPQMFLRGEGVYTPMPGGMLSVPSDGRDVSPGDTIPIGALASALANAPPEMQHRMLREGLCPLVEEVEGQHAAEITGMLMQMGQAEVLHLLESPQALNLEVAEAMGVLSALQQQQQSPSSAIDQLAALSLNDELKLT